jgi:hypothetical protein
LFTRAGQLSTKPGIDCRWQYGQWWLARFPTSLLSHNSTLHIKYWVESWASTRTLLALQYTLCTLCRRCHHASEVRMAILNGRRTGWLVRSLFTCKIPPPISAMYCNNQHIQFFVMNLCYALFAKVEMRS